MRTVITTGLNASPWGTMEVVAKNRNRNTDSSSNSSKNNNRNNNSSSSNNNGYREHGHYSNNDNIYDNSSPVPGLPRPMDEVNIWGRG